MKDEIKDLFVAETFSSIQGEGQTMGKPAVFLRLSGCNLLCNGVGWICDTIEVWRKGTRTKFENVLTDEQVKELEKGSHLIITGGEPLLHQNAIERYILWFWRTKGFQPAIEIETNGTIMPSKALVANVHYWNVSFKLSTSGEPWERRVHEDVLRFFSRGAYNVIFKIVISCESDGLELVNDFQDIIDFRKLVLMPAGATREELNATRPIAAELAKTLHARYSDRLHIAIWDKKTGV
jgi:7-carboxy-7-deazaguanine synthase